jgi:redox-sensitive bicupin YhaK (pirin superfamily)
MLALILNIGTVVKAAARFEIPRMTMLEQIIEPRARDLGGFSVRRVLPSSRRRQVGPVVFFDHMGPVDFAPGAGMDVRPHPHINLATVTYLWEGVIDHRDSLGSFQPIRPGAINWMTAGRGIVHSERTPAEVRAAAHRLHGTQLWVALPAEHEQMPPEFQHHPAHSLPQREQPGCSLRLLAGSAFGAVSPVRVASPLFYADAVLQAGAELDLPAEYPERAAYLLEGSLSLDDTLLTGPQLLVFHEGPARLRAASAAHVLLFGGTPLESARHIWWNFVSSSAERIERAKQDWREGRFPLVPGDEQERVPLPEEPR